MNSTKVVFVRPLLMILCNLDWLLDADFSTDNCKVHG